jgi:2-phospho-L-lactate guanylyltransferase (CobY/MobA/RfbA family)
MEVRFFKAVYNGYNEYNNRGDYYVQELDDALDIFEDRRFEYVEFAQPCTADDLDDIIGKDSPFAKNESLKKFIEAVNEAESIFCYGEGGGTSYCNYFLVNI